MLAAKGIRANSVAPGPTWTPLIRATMPEQRSTASRRSSAIVEHWDVFDSWQRDELGSRGRHREARGGGHAEHQIERSGGDADRHLDLAEPHRGAASDGRAQRGLKAGRVAEVVQVPAAARADKRQGRLRRPPKSMTRASAGALSHWPSGAPKRERRRICPLRAMTNARSGSARVPMAR